VKATATMKMLKAWSKKLEVAVLFSSAGIS
jgi:hypothetical protein